MTAPEPGVVWIVESGDYSDRGIDLVADSPERALEALKARYAPPYEVEWGDLRRNADDAYEVDAAFSAVPGKSTLHSQTYDIDRWEVAVTSPAVASGEERP